MENVGDSHVNLQVHNCRLMISLLLSHLGASPDAIVKCDCCGKGVVEMKCSVLTIVRNRALKLLVKVFAWSKHMIALSHIFQTSYKSQLLLPGATSNENL